MDEFGQGGSELMERWDDMHGKKVDPKWVSEAGKEERNPGP